MGSAASAQVWLAPSLAEAMDLLVEALQAERRAGRTLFAPQLLLTGSSLASRALERDLAERLGATADLRFGTLVAEVRRWLLGALEEGEQLAEGARLRARLATTLQRLADEALEAPEALRPIERWLRGPGGRAARSERAGGLGVRLAALFERYQLERPEMVAAWSASSGEGPGSGEHEEASLLGLAPEERADPERLATARWQRWLWRVACGHEAPDGAAVGLATPLRSLPELWSRLAGVPPTTVPPPPAPSIWLLAPSGWPQLVHRVVAHWRQQGVRIAAVLLDPAPESSWWVDALADRATRRVLDETALLSPVLARWGRPLAEVNLAVCEALQVARERARSLVTWSSAAEDDPLRARLRAGLGLGSLPRASRPASTAAGDASLLAVAAHEPRREVEWATERIWRLLEEARAANRPLRLDEIGVLLAGSERQHYQALVERVFPTATAGGAAPEGLPFVLLERPLLEGSRAGQAVARLLDLPLHPPSRPRWLDALLHPCMLAASPEADPEQWVELLARAGALHGLDADDHAETYFGPSGPHFEQALRRLALGQLLAGERTGAAGWAQPPGEGAPPLRVEEGGEAAQALLGRLDELVAWARLARDECLPIARWAAEARVRIESMLAAEHPEDERVLGQVLRALSDLERADEPGEPVPYRLYHAVALRELQGLVLRDPRAPGGGVLVGSLRALRRLPLRHVLVLGLREGEFPVGSPPDAVDLRLPATVGDRPIGGAPRHQTPTARDRLAFLELLMGPSESLALCWPAVESTTAEPIPPSSVLEELDAWLQAQGEPLPRCPTRRRRWEEEAPPSGEAPGDAPPAPAAEAHAVEAAEVFEAAARERRAWRAGQQLRAAGRYAGSPQAQAEWMARLREGADPERTPHLEPLPEPPALLYRGRPLSEGAEASVGVTELGQWLRSPLQGWARVALGMERLALLPAEAQEEEPFSPGNLARSRVLQEALLAAAAHGWQLDAAMAAYERAVAEQRASGQWPWPPLADHAAQAHAQLLDAWCRTGAARLGTGWRPWRAALGGAGRLPPGLPLHVLPALHLPYDTARLVVGGALEPLLRGPGGEEAFVLTLRKEGGKTGVGTKLLVHARPRVLRPFLSHLLLCAAGEPRPRVAWAWSAPTALSAKHLGGGMGVWSVRYRFAPLAPEQAREALVQMVEGLLAPEPPGRLPAGPALAGPTQKKAGDKRKPKAGSPTTLREVLTGWDGRLDAGKSRNTLHDDAWGPLPSHWVEALPEPDPEVARHRAMRRLGPFGEHTEEAADPGWLVRLPDDEEVHQ